MGRRKSFRVPLQSSFFFSGTISLSAVTIQLVWLLVLLAPRLQRSEVTLSVLIF